MSRRRLHLTAKSLEGFRLGITKTLRFPIAIITPLKRIRPAYAPLLQRPILRTWRLVEERVVVGEGAGVV
jgi:hypothetical protein